MEALDLDPGKERAIAALLTEPTLQAAADRAGISYTTLWRYMQQDDFQRAYRSARRDALAQATARLQAVATEAVEALRDVLNNARYSPYARVQAAKAILDLAYRASEIEDVQDRIVALEAQLGGTDGR